MLTGLLYAPVRFFLEYLRPETSTDPRYVGLTFAQWCSIIAFGAAAYAAIACSRTASPPRPITPTSGEMQQKLKMILKEDDDKAEREEEEKRAEEKRTTDKKATEDKQAKSEKKTEDKKTEDKLEAKKTEDKPEAKKASGLSKDKADVAPTEPNDRCPAEGHHQEGRRGEGREEGRRGEGRRGEGRDVRRKKSDDKKSIKDETTKADD